MRKNNVSNAKKGGNTIKETVISSECFIKGEFISTSNRTAFINCDITGHCESRGELIIGPDATIEGDIKGSVVVIQGRVDGNIEASTRLELLTTAIVHGDIVTKSLVVDENAIFVGNCNMSGDKSTSKPDEDEDDQDLEFLEIGKKLG